MKTRVALLGCLCVWMCALAACGDDEGEPQKTPKLPSAPQILANPDLGFVLFPLTQAGNDVEFPLTLGNGGESDLVISSITLEILNDGPAGTFTMTLPNELTVATRDVVVVPLTFSPPARGVFQGRITVASNADNAPSLEVNLIGPGAANLLNDSPDLAFFEDFVPAKPVGNTQVVFARIMNLGAAPLRLYNYNIGGEDPSFFDIQTGQALPSAECPASCPVVEEDPACTPIILGAGAWVVLSIEYTPDGATSYAEFHVVSNDADTCEAVLDIAGA